MAFSGASNFVAQDNTFNDVAGDQINNYSTYNLTVTSVTQYGEEFDWLLLITQGRSLTTLCAVEEVVNAITSIHNQGPQSPSEITGDTLHDLLDQAVAAGNQPLNWRESIVDLLKLLKFNSSFTTRKTLALKWGYQGDPNKSYDMNVWLHKHVMGLLKDNGGDLEGKYHPFLTCGLLSTGWPVVFCELLMQRFSWPTTGIRRTNKPEFQIHYHPSQYYCSLNAV